MIRTSNFRSILWSSDVQLLSSADSSCWNCHLCEAPSSYHVSNWPTKRSKP